MTKIIDNINNSITHFFFKKPVSLRDRKQYYKNHDYPILNYSDEHIARMALDKIDHFTMTSYERMLSLWEQVCYLDRAGIPGCLVECGTWRGGASGMMALAHMYCGSSKRKIHLFDSFEGLPEPDANKDGNKAIQYAMGRATGEKKTIQKCVGSLEENQHVLWDIVQYPKELTFFHKGWFQDTIPSDFNNIGPIALLRLDGDWFESTRVCMEYLFPLVTKGGFIVIDDYGHWEGCKKAIDEYLLKYEKLYFLHYIDRAARYLVK